MARPTYASDGTLLDGGIDLNMNEGMAEYVYDLIQDSLWLDDDDNDD